MAANPTSDAKRNGRAKRQPVDRILPEDVRNAIKATLSAAPGIDADLVDRLDQAHDLTGRFGLSRRRLQLYLRQQQKRCGAVSDHASPLREDGDEPWRRRIDRHRRRQASVAAVLDQTFGALAASNPDLWERRAYLMLVGLVYERLATQEDEISTDELVSLAKILAENRRANGRARDPSAEPVGVEAPPSSGRLPPHFASLVRQVYGANVTASNDALGD